MKACQLFALLLTLVLAAGLAACGGGGSSSTTSTATPTSSSSEPGLKAKGGSVTFGKAHPRETAATRAERRRAGRAAAFVAPGSDNSVPTFGSEANASERDRAEAALEAYLQAREREDWGRACRELAKPTRQGYEKLAKGRDLGCAPVLAALSKGADLSDPLTGHLLALRVHGANAFALFYGPGHQQYMVPMNLEAGEWRPTQAAPIAYPPGTP